MPVLVSDRTDVITTDVHQCRRSHLISCKYVRVTKTFPMRRNKQVEKPKYNYNLDQS